MFMLRAVEHSFQRTPGTDDTVWWAYEIDRYVTIYLKIIKNKSHYFPTQHLPGWSQ
jgi:hypothetical protein